jgi:uncharacterized protein YecE (DUF72 family)
MIYLGTAGFSYPDWKGRFYPERFESRHMLEFYSARFPVVEVNSSWYAIPPPSRFASMASRTPDGFRFVVKAYQGITHQVPGRPEDFRAFLSAIRPLEEKAKLAAVLVQFPWGFKNTPDNRSYLESLRERMGDLAVVVEFRNQGWAVEATWELLRELKMAFCCVDEPPLKGLMEPRAVFTAEPAYVRFHGRNRLAWWDRGRESWERYDYLYSREELEEWTGKVRELASQAKDVYLIFNNHYRGQAVRNARMMAGLLPPETVVPLGDEDEGVGGEADGKAERPLF